MEERNIPYFRNLWQANMTDLEGQCVIWEEICLNNSVPDEVHGDIRTNIGLAKLLMNQKLKQFKGLIDDSEFNTGEKEITCLDLQGFWDMVYNEVEKIKNLFDRLEKCKNNDWRFEEENSGKLLKKKVPVKREVITYNKKDDSSKSRALAAKQRLAEAKKKMLALSERQKEQNFVEIMESNKDSFNYTQDLNSEDKGKFLNNTETTKKPNGNSQQDLCINGKRISSLKTSDQIKTVVQKKDIKYKGILPQSLTPSIQNKENFVPDDDGSNIKCNSKTQTKSKESSGLPSVKKRGKSKEFGKLQCVTRSAKKALLVQQHSVQES